VKKIENGTTGDFIDSPNKAALKEVK